MEPFGMQTRLQLLNDCRNFIAGKLISANLKRFFQILLLIQLKQKHFVIIILNLVEKKMKQI